MTETFAGLERRALSTLYEYHMLDVAAGFFHRVDYTESIGAIREQFVELFHERVVTASYTTTRPWTTSFSRVFRIPIG